MRVSRSTVESLIIILDMVKEEDKGRGCVLFMGLMCSFHLGLFWIIQGRLQLSREAMDGAKNPCLRFFSKFFNIIVHKLPS
jgi:hypothetical protein